MLIRAGITGIFRITDHRATINFAIVTLAFFVLFLTGERAWDAFFENRAARDMVQANQMADHLIKAAGIHAVERGLTAGMLGRLASRQVEATEIITQLRTSGDAEWSKALALAQRLSAHLEADSALAATIRQAQREFANLSSARTLVDACLKGDGCAYQAESWLATMTRFIGLSARLREAAFHPLDTPLHVAQINMSLKHWVWLASEHAGRERGMLAYYISARLPLPTAVLDELKATRGVVDRSIFDIQAIAELKHTDLRIADSVRRMETLFLGRFNDVRRKVYEEAATGNYSQSGSQWMEASTHALDAILDVASTVRQVTDEYTAQAIRENVMRMLRHAIVLAITLVLAIWSLTKVRQTANSLFKQKELAEVTLHSIGDAVITTDAAARVEYLNPIAEQMTGWKTSEAAGKPLADVCVLVNGVTHEPEPNPVERCLHEQKVVGLAGNVVLKAKDGKEYLIEDSAAPIRDRLGNIIGAVMVFYDVTQMRHTPHLLSYHATHDALTGLVNRREFERRLADLLVRAKNLGQQHAFCYIDLDQFKVINDTCGHAVGDKLLRQLTYLLQEGMRDTDTLARLGGDEFGVLLENCPLDRALRIAEGLRKVIKDFRFSWQGRTFDLGASIGLVPINIDSVSPEEALSEADAACYVAKEKGRNRVQIFQPGNLELAKRHGEMQWVSRIKEALEQKRFRLYYQAIQPLNGDSARHGEILLRLAGENGEIVPPMTFIPAAERYNLMPAVDAWVVRTGLETIARYLKEQPSADGLVCNINLSGATLGEEGFENYVLEQLALHQVPPQCICFEITETAAVANLEHAAVFIKTFQAKGCRFALDDFGTGLSSFGYLKALPVDYLKIDGSFVRVMHEDPVAYAMVQAINTVGHVMGIQTIAEYVENDAILEKLRELGVDFAQGYAVGKPQPIEQSLGVSAS